MSSILSKRVRKIKPSATISIIEKANELKSRNIKVIHMCSGELDFDTPSNIKNAAIDAIRDGRTKYTAVDGTIELKKAICNKFMRDNKLVYNINEVIASCGGKQVFYNLCQAILDEGDEVIIPGPYWVSYPDIVLLAGATPVIIKTDINTDFKITPEQLESYINKNSKLLVLNSPSNPSGVVYIKKEIEELGKVLERHPRVFIISDDIYEHILLDGNNFVNIAMVCPKLKDRIIILNGVSKAYAMTGWRIGYAAGPENIIKAMKKIQGQSTSNPSSISQAAAIEALNGEQTSIGVMTEALTHRHNFLLNSLNAIDGIECSRSFGAFYLFPNVQVLIDRLGLCDDIEFATYCLEKLNIALVPGSAFGAPGYVRLSFSTSMDNIKEAVERLEKI